MANFMTRVELHGVRHDSEIYERLHAAMEKAGFSRQIESADGMRFHLAPAGLLGIRAAKSSSVSCGNTSASFEYNSFGSALPPS
jgi:hypothetical protein